MFNSTNTHPNGGRPRLAAKSILHPGLHPPSSSVQDAGNIGGSSLDERNNIISMARRTGVFGRWSTVEVGAG